VRSTSISAFSSTIGPREVLIERRRLHEREITGADQTPAGVGQRHVHGDHIGLEDG
jgi:hypothetical protein